MHYTKKLKRLSTLIASCLLALSIVGVASAQQAAPQLIQVNQLDIKPEHVERFRAIHRDVFIPASRSRGLAWRNTSRVALGNTLQMTVATPIDNMAALDSPPGIGMTELEQELALEIWNTAVQARTSFVVTSRPDMSLPGQPNTGTTVVYRFQVKSGHIPAFIQTWTGKVLPALTASGVQGTQVFQTVYGGKVGEFFSLTPVPGMAFADGPGPFSGLSPQEAADLNAELAGHLDEMELNITRIDQELSFGLPGLQP